MRATRRLAATFVLILSLPGSAWASAGGLDGSFAGSGYSVQQLGSWVGAVASVVQPDGKIVTAGEASINGTSEMVSTRLNPNGSMDTSYGIGGWVIININGSSAANAIKLQPDGKIVLAGTGNGDGKLDFAAVRLNPNGSLDPSFGNGGIATVPIGSAAIANALTIAPDGKLALGGTATLTHNEFAAARLNPNGSLDPTFGQNGTTTLPPPAAAWGMVQQNDGKLILAGQTTTPNNNQAYIAARLTTTGTLDTSYGSSGIVTIPIGSWAQANAIALQPTDGKTIITGNAYTDADVAATVRLTSTGALDPTFGTGGISTFTYWNAVNAVAIQPGDGKIVIGGTGATAARLNPNGTLDQTFGSTGVTTIRVGSSSDAANGVTVEPGDGKIVLVGTAVIAGRAQLSVIRLSGSGSTGTSSQPGPPPANGHTPPTATKASIATAITRIHARVSRDRSHHRRRHRRSHHR